MIENRIRSISDIEDEAGRLEAYSRLFDQISLKLTTSLSQSELQELALNLSSENVSLIQHIIWRLLVTATPLEFVRSFAVKMLQNHDYSNRGDAMLYLRVHYPKLMPQLFELYKSDFDPEVRYQLTEHLASFDLEAAVDMKINLLPVESHELNDALTIEISEMGNGRHLDQLWRKDALAGGGTVFERIAGLLNAKLRRSSNPIIPS